MKTRRIHLCKCASPLYDSYVNLSKENVLAIKEIWFGNQKVNFEFYYTLMPGIDLIVYDDFDENDFVIRKLGNYHWEFNEKEKSFLIKKD